MLTPFVMVTALCLTGCRDNPAMAGVDAASGGARFAATAVCAVNVKARTTKCEIVRDVPHGDPARHRLTIIRDAQAMVETGSDAYTPADSTYRLNVRLTNSGETVLGTRDGTIATGITAFIPVNVMGYAGRPPGDTTKPVAFLLPPLTNINNLVHAKNPDGRVAFTAANQPYWHYAERLQPGETSQWRGWKFTLHPSVSYFYFAVSILAAVPGEPSVPATAPNGFLVPVDTVNALYDASHRVTLHPRMSGPYPRGVLLLTFKPTAGAISRQAAIDLVDGTVIGGDGVFYMVRIADDPSAAALWDAIDVLQSLPQVQFVGPDTRVGWISTYRIPYDGPQWQRQNWALTIDSARGDNWALESISAPLAWGCESDGSSVQATVVDREDLHGRWVAAIMAQRGNDSLMMTGVAWRGNVVTTDPSVGGTVTGPAAILNFANHLVTAIQSAAVINLSVGTGYVDAAHQPRLPDTLATQPNFAADTLQAANGYLALRELIRNGEAATANRPLYVIAAGNFQLNAGYSGFPRLGRDSVFGPRAVVVAAADSTRGAGKTRALWANTGQPLERGSNFGPLVDVAAPGANVAVILPSAPGTLSLLSGTSFAAPHVAGVAMLLKAFDARLTAEQLKTLLVQGAQNGGWAAGGFPYLNAHESLKQAALAPGAPLCGNRVWTDGRAVVAQRGTAVDTIARLGPWVSRNYVDVLHGGRTVRVAYRGLQDLGPDSTLTYTLQNNAWMQSGAGPGSWTEYVRGSSGSYLGTLGRSHEGDSLVTAVTDNVSEVATLQLALTWAGGSRNLLATPLTRSVPSDRLRNLCIVRASPPTSPTDSIGACTIGTYYSGFSSYPGWEVAYSPLGKEVIVASAVYRSVSTVSAWSACPWAVTPTTPARQCRSITEADTYLPTEVKAVNVASGAVRPVFAVPDRYLRRMVVDETGTEVMLQRELYTEQRTYGPGQAYGSYVLSTPPGQHHCAIEAYDLTTGSKKATIPSNCSGTDHGLFFSPVKAARTSYRLMQRP